MENLYCTIFIVDVSQNPEEVETVSSRIQQLIEDHGGIIKRVNPWGKQKLAYPILKKNYGYYVEIEFTANSNLNIPKIIEQEYRINDRVLRYLTYVVTKKELQQRSINAARMKESAPKSEEVERSSPVQEFEEDELETTDSDEDTDIETPTQQKETSIEEKVPQEQEEMTEEKPDEKKESKEE